MKRLALFGVIAVLGTLGGLGGSPAAATASGALREILPPARRAATTGDPFQIGSNYYGWASLNWSGYAVTATSYTAVTGSWIVPTVTPSGGPTYSSAWTGIGGFDTNDLIQTGTEQDSSHGQTTYSAWWTTNEELDAPQEFPDLSCVSSPCSGTPSTFDVHDGDAMTASITETTANIWAITLTDNTTGVKGTKTNISHTASDGSSGGDSAEWIIERPAFVSPSGAAHFTKLADYGTTTFDLGTVNGGNPGLVANSNSSDAGIMVQGAVKVISIPSAPDSDTDGFSISYGNTAPSPPSS